MASKPATPCNEDDTANARGEPLTLGVALSAFERSGAAVREHDIHRTTRQVIPNRSPVMGIYGLRWFPHHRSEFHRLVCGQRSNLRQAVAPELTDLQSSLLATAN